MVDDRATLDVRQLVAEYHQAVYRYAYRLTGSVPDAEDLTQQVFLTAQEKLGQLRQIESVRGWLFAILRNYFLKSCQKRRPIPAENLQLNMDAIPAKIPPEAQVDREQLQQAIDELPDNYRLVLTMFYYEGSSYREIAKRLELPIGTVMSRLARAKDRLRSKLFESEDQTAINRRQSVARQGG